MAITVVNFDDTVDEGSWTKSGFAGEAHTGLDTVTAGSETTYMQAAGVGAGVMKLSVPEGPPEIQRVNYVRLSPLLIAGENSANVPILRVQLVVDGAVKQMKSFSIDTGDEFELKEIEFGPLDMLGSEWRASNREVWFYTIAATTGHSGDDPIPDGS